MNNNLNQIVISQFYSLRELPLSAEIFLSCAILQLTIFAVSNTNFKGKFSSEFMLFNNQMYYLGILILSLTTLLVLNEDTFIIHFFSSNNSIANDYLSFIAKLIICITSVCFFLIVKNSYKNELVQNNFEYVVLILVSILGLLLISCSNDLLTAYLSIELHSIALYIMTAFKKNSSYAIESSLKYFIIGSLSSSFFLFGSVLIYGCIGTVNFDDFKIFFPLLLLLLSSKESSENTAELLQENFPGLDLDEIGSFTLSSMNIYEYLRCYGVSNPLFILLENVENLLPHYEDMLDFFSGAIHYDYTDYTKVALAESKIKKHISNSECLVDWFLEKNPKNTLLNSNFYLNKTNSDLFYLNKVWSSVTFPNNEINFVYMNFMICMYYNLHSFDSENFIYHNSLVYSIFFCEGFARFCSHNDHFFATVTPKIFRFCSPTGPTFIEFISKKGGFFLSASSLYAQSEMFPIWQTFNNYDVLNINTKFLFIVDILKHLNETSSDGSLYLNLNLNQFDIFALASVGFILIFVSLFIKLAIAPFHFWSLDVYEGAPNTTTFFFVIMPKIAILVLFLRICYSSFYSIFSLNKFYFFIFAVLSILVGSFGGLEQRKLKSLLAYSSISHTGYLLLSFSTNTLEGMQMMLYYIIVYMIANLCFWAVYLFLRQKQNYYFNKQNKELGDLVLLKESNPMIAFILSIALFSIAGIPPIVGFLAKIGIFLVVIKSSAYLISLIIIIISVASTFYYIRFIKILYFENILVGKLYFPISTKKSLIISILFFLLVLLCIDPLVMYLLFQKAILLSNY